ncbi:MAG TPA: IS110 family transposase [Thermoleophilia bacterium]|nr:IS110 family transposase [Thermoleophilia bacterium]
MPELAGRVDYVIGVDTHRDTHTAAAVDRVGGVLEGISVCTSQRGSKELLDFAQATAPGRRCWAIEGTGIYGASLTRFLLARGEWVVEVERPRRPARRRGKSDELDAIAAAREALAGEHLAEPRSPGERAALQMLLTLRRHLVQSKVQAIGLFKTLLVTAPDALRESLAPLSTAEQVGRAARLRERRTVEEDTSVVVLRSLARRILASSAEAEELRARIGSLITALAPQLLARPGVGVLAGAQVFVVWSHPGRLRSEAAFASLAGVAPIPASSGQSRRYRLNRGGDRQLNCALHTIVLTRLRCHPPTMAYAARRLAEGKSPREIRRCLKRYVARELFKLLEGSTQMS